MYVITGITGQVGGVVARTLLDASHPVRAILRDPQKAAPWTNRGCEIALANFDDAPSLTAAFRGAEAVFILVPPNFDPAPGFPEARSLGALLRNALDTARPGRVVYLSTIGAQATQPNLLTQHTIIESALAASPVPITFLRPAWFMENASWDLPPARDLGIIPSFLQPLDKAFPMIATGDIGKTAARLLQQKWSGPRTVEIEGPKRISPNEIAATFSSLLHRPVRMEAVPRDSWETLFKSQGTKNPTPRIRMLDGFNEGWIDFERPPSEIEKCSIPLETVLKSLIDRSTPSP